MRFAAGCVSAQVKKKLDSAIVEKLPPLNLAQSRYATRTKKPVREAIHDDVETSLLQQYQQIKVCARATSFSE